MKPATYYSPTRAESVEKEAASKAGHVVDPANEMQLWASAIGNAAKRLKRKALPRADLREELLIAQRIDGPLYDAFSEDIVASKLILRTASSVADRIRCRLRCSVS